MTDAEWKASPVRAAIDANHALVHRLLIRECAKVMPTYAITQDGKQLYWTGRDGKRKEPV